MPSRVVIQDSGFDAESRDLADVECNGEVSACWLLRGAVAGAIGEGEVRDEMRIGV